MLVESMTHDDIADFTAKNLKSKGWHVTFSNMTDPIQHEQPDALGINIYGDSILCEVKTSRSDFMADAKKEFRLYPERGMGDYRVYVTPKGLLSPQELPYGWMLWEVHGRVRPIMKVIKGKKDTKKKHPIYSWSSTVSEYPNTNEEEYYHFRNTDKNYRREFQWLHKIIRRAEEDGIDMNLYSKGETSRRRYATK